MDRWWETPGTEPGQKRVCGGVYLEPCGPEDDSPWIISLATDSMGEERLEIPDAAVRRLCSRLMDVFDVEGK